MRRAVTAAVLVARQSVAGHRCLSSLQSLNSHRYLDVNSGNSVGRVQQLGWYSLCSPATRACLSSEANKDDVVASETVAEFYQKMLDSVNARTMPPNAWLWSLISNCSNQEDIKLLFQILHKLRIFRLSNLRIHSNFNSHLCLRVSEACARAGALDYGIKALWKHNVYGLTPSIGSAHYLLLYAKEHNDTKLMAKIIRVLEKNSLPLQPGTADIVLSICYNANRWDLMSKLATKFVSAGVKLHRATFDIWMEFASKVGDAQAIWKIDKIRAKSVKQTTVASGFSCAKGFLLEHNPDSAAATIHLLSQNLPEKKKPEITTELHKLVNDWTFEVLKRCKEEDKKTLAESLQSDVPAMVASLINMGLAVEVDLEVLKRQSA